jgi:hypothetical protein
VRLVEDQQRLALALGEHGVERRLVLGPAQRLVRDDEPRVGQPRVHAKPAILPPPLDERAVVQLEAEAEPRRHLALPLRAHRGGRDDHDQLDLVAQQQLLQHEPRLDRLAQADVVRDEQVGPRQIERALERRQLVQHQLHAGAERRLEQPGIGGRDPVPAERVVVRAERPRRVQPLDLAEQLRARIEHTRPELELPEDVGAAALVVVVEPDQRDPRRVRPHRRRVYGIDQVLPVPHYHDIATARQVTSARVLEDRRDRVTTARQPSRLEQGPG